MDHSYFLKKTPWGQSSNERNWFLDRIVSKLSALRSIILLSPHGWGELSLAIKVGIRIMEQNYDVRTCYMDLQGVATSEAFLNLFTANLTAMGAPSIEPEENHVIQSYQALNLPEFLAGRDHLKIIIFIGNFHQIAKFEDSVTFQKKLRSKWKQQRHCAYCLYGNNPQMARYLLDIPYAPLKTFLQIFNLPRIDSNDWTRFIQKGFQESGKQISDKAALRICILTNQIYHYVQLLAHHSWLRTTTRCTIQIVNEAMEDMMMYFKTQYQTLADSLTESQLGYLRMLLNCDRRFCSKQTLAKYNLKSSSRVARLRESLINKCIIRADGFETFFLDPIFGYWLDKYYFSP